jgi:alkanesulfonate monooxygenase SsuD/methylene tetrahydromethanopterin reductase-like flavin-dependent oxidoreductase (luciferase family)
VPPPVKNFVETLDPYRKAVVDDALGAAVVGGPETVRRGLEDFVAQTGADEFMVTANIYDHEKRKRSFAIIADVAGVGRSPG